MDPFWHLVLEDLRLASEALAGGHDDSSEEGQEVIIFRSFLRDVLRAEAETSRTAYEFEPVYLAGSAERVRLCDRLAAEVGGLF